MPVLGDTVATSAGAAAAAAVVTIILSPGVIVTLIARAESCYSTHLV